MPALARFTDCEHSVFISYAHADDELNNNWVSDFAIEFRRDLEAALASKLATGAGVPGVYLSKFTGPVAGNLGDELRAQVRKAFALCIVVDEKYAGSEWCGRELEYFRDAFGTEGLDQRLYIVALRERPMQQVAASARWQQVFAGRNPVWKPFFDPDDLHKRPVPVRRDVGPGLTTGFFDRYQRLRDDLLDKICADLSVASAPPPQPRWLVGACNDELRARAERFADELAEHEPQVGTIAPDTLLRSKALSERMQAANVLVLPFNDGQPYTDLVDGGHLALQLNAWRKLGRRDDSAFLLDLTDIPAAHAAEPQHLQFLASCGLARLKPAQLLDVLAPKPVQAAPDAARRPSQAVRVFIESNRNEPDEWKKLGSKIRQRWDQLLREQRVDAPLSLRTAGFDIDAMDAFPLDQADGLILLWGQKDARSLLSQINKVEDLATQYAPMIVAHLSPPQPPSAQRMPAMQWDVLRFNARQQPPPAALEPPPDEEERLTAFVQEVLDSTLRRRAAAPPVLQA